MGLVPRPRVSIVIPAFNHWDYTVRCLLAVFENTRGIAHEVIVVDNASTDETARGLAQLPEVQVLRNDRNLGFGRACNQGAASAAGELVLFLNSDTAPRPGWLAPLVAALDRDPRRGIAGSRLLFPDGTIQHAGLLLAYGSPTPVAILPRDYGRPAAAGPPSGPVRAVTGACMLVRAALFAELGGFDEGYCSGYEDVDLCLRAAERGSGTAYVAESVVVHHEAVSGGRFANEAANLDRFQRTWMGRLDRFDLDYRRDVGTAAKPQHPRPPVSIVVVARDALTTLAPCLESIRETIGPEDEIILVDDGSFGASAQALELLCARLPAARLVRISDPGPFARAAHAGLARATRPMAAVLGANVKVSPGWLEGLISARERDSRFAIVSPVLAGRDATPGASLFAPAPRTAANPSVAPARSARVPGSFCLLGARDDLLAAAAEEGVLFGARPARLAEHLAGRGLGLGGVPSVFVQRLNPLGDEADPTLRARALERQDELAAREERFHAGARDAWSAANAPAGDDAPVASIIIPVLDNLRLTREAIDSVYAHTRLPFELVLVDNGSAEDVRSCADELAARHGNVRYLRNDTNQGFAYACNQGMAAARGRYLVLLNNDVRVARGWLTRQLALLEADPGIGIVGPCTNATSGPQLVGTAIYRGLATLDDFARQWALEHAGEIGLRSRIVGLCMVMRRELLDRVGGFDTLFGYGNFEDDDLCVRVMRAGLRIAIAYDVFIHHHGSATFKQMKLDPTSMVEENWALFCAKWRHDSGDRSEAALRRLAGAAPFEAARDHVPVDYGAVFSPRAAPLDVGTPKPVRLLVVAAAREGAWRDIVATYLRTFRAGDPVALLLRVEPPAPDRVDALARELVSLHERLGLREEDAPDIVVDASPIAPRLRGGLYTAATAYLASGGRREPFFTREAACCGLPVLAAGQVTSERLRQIARAAAGGIAVLKGPHVCASS